MNVNTGGVIERNLAERNRWRLGGGGTDILLQHMVGLSQTEIT
jgi:hypothetical protein